MSYCPAAVVSRSEGGSDGGLLPLLSFVTVSADAAAGGQLAAVYVFGGPGLRSSKKRSWLCASFVSRQQTGAKTEGGAAVLLQARKPKWQANPADKIEKSSSRVASRRPRPPLIPQVFIGGIQTVTCRG
jgi:hypothetical protein